jgi:hypothetical protein
MLKVGTCHYTGNFFPGKTRVLKWVVFPFLVIFCLHNAKCPCIFLPVATVASSVITDFEILNICTSKKDKHYFWKLVAKKVKWVNKNMGPWKWISHHFCVVWDLNQHNTTSQARIASHPLLTWSVHERDNHRNIRTPALYKRQVDIASHPLIIWSVHVRDNCRNVSTPVLYHKSSRDSHIPDPVQQQAGIFTQLK